MSMDLGVNGKVAMVAAGSKGLGLATARALAAEGCVVSICGRNEDSLKAARESIGENARSYVADVSKPEDIKRWVGQTKQALGAPDILVTNTGGPPAGSVFAMTDEQW